MAIFNEKQLKQHIKEKNFFRVYLFFGNEAYLKQSYVDLIVSKTVDPAFEGLNHERFDGKSADLRDVYDRAILVPMMSEKRCIVVDSFKLEGLNAAQVKEMDAKFAALPESTVLIFKQNEFSKKSGKKVIDVFDKYGAVCELNKRSGVELYRPLMSMAAKLGCEMDSSVASYLVSCVGDDFNTLVNEVTKVCNYAGGGVITREHIDKTAVKTVDAKVYQLTKALLGGSFDRAHEVLDVLLRQKIEPEYIFGAIAGTYIDMYRVKVMLNSGEAPSALKEYFNYRGREFTIENARRDCAGMDAATLRRCLDVLAQTDIRMKTGRSSGAAALEQLMVRLMLTARGKKV